MAPETNINPEHVFDLLRELADFNSQFTRQAMETRQSVQAGIIDLPPQLLRKPTGYDDTRREIEGSVFGWPEQEVAVREIVQANIGERNADILNQLGLVISGYGTAKSENDEIGERTLTVSLRDADRFVSYLRSLQTVDVDTHLALTQFLRMIGDDIIESYSITQPEEDELSLLSKLGTIDAEMKRLDVPAPPEFIACVGTARHRLLQKFVQPFRLRLYPSDATATDQWDETYERYLEAFETLDTLKTSAQKFADPDLVAAELELKEDMRRKSRHIADDFRPGNVSRDEWDALIKRIETELNDNTDYSEA